MTKIIMGVTEKPAGYGSNLLLDQQMRFTIKELQRLHTKRVGVESLCSQCGPATNSTVPFFGPLTLLLVRSGIAVVALDDVDMLVQRDVVRLAIGIFGNTAKKDALRIEYSQLHVAMSKTMKKGIGGTQLEHTLRMRKITRALELAETASHEEALEVAYLDIQQKRTENFIKVMNASGVSTIVVGAALSKSLSSIAPGCEYRNMLYDMLRLNAN